MKSFILMSLVSIAGCAALGSAPATHVNSASSPATASADVPPAPSAPTLPEQNMGPRLIIPVTGGAPILGIPFGGNMYLPITGGAPVMGMPLSP